MTAFTPEQIAVLQAAFEHVWARFARLQSDHNEDAARLLTLLQLLVERGILTAEQFEAAADELMATAGIESGLASLARQRPTDGGITGEILRGDVDAFNRRRAEEDEEDD